MPGRCGRKTLARVKREFPSCQAFVINIYPQTLGDLSHGRIGTYKLLNVEQPLLNQDMPAKRNQKIFDLPEETMSLTPEEHILVENFRYMAAEQKAVYKTMGDALAQPKVDKLVG